MTNEELIIAQAKQLMHQNSVIEYYRNRCDALETELRLQDKTMEPNPVGMVNAAKMQEAHNEDHE